MSTKKESVDNLVAILEKFKVAANLKINWNRSITYWFGRGDRLEWLNKYQWQWAPNGNISKLLSIPFEIHPNISDVGAFLLNSVKNKLAFWVKARLSLANRILVVNYVFLSTLWYFITIWIGSKGVLSKFRTLLNIFSPIWNQLPVLE